MSEAVPEEPDEPVNPDDEPDEDEDEDEDSADTDEPEREQATDMVMEKLYRQVETKARNYVTGQVAMLKQTEAGWQGCPCCGLPGFVQPYDPANPDDQLRKLNVDEYFHAAKRNLQHARDRQECDWCGGEGDVLSYSKKPQHEEVPCSKCNGTGYVLNVDAQLVHGTIPAPPPPSPPLSALANGAEQGPDVFGRPAGHKDYGVPPAYVNA